MHRKLNFAAGAALALLALGHSAKAQTILSSNFNTQTSVNGATSFTGIVWSAVNGLSPSSSIALSSGSTVQRNGNTANLTSLAVAHNIDTAGPFSLTVSLGVDATHEVSLSGLSYNYQFISGAGIFQAHEHPNSGIFTLNVLDSLNESLGTASVGPLGTSNVASNSGSSTITFGTPVLLSSGQTYSLVLQVSSNSTLGNNVSVDNFAYEGTVSDVPEPSPAILSIFGLAGIVAFRRRRK